MALTTLLLLCLGCNGKDEPSSPENDPNIVRDGQDLRKDPSFVSPPTLAHPIYACSSNVTVKNFRHGAKLSVFLATDPTPIGGLIGELPTLGANVSVSIVFSEGQVVHATQTIDGVDSAPSLPVTVTSHTEDFPNGLPTPHLWKHPLYECGAAVLVEDVVPGSSVRVVSASPAGGGFGTESEVGSFAASTEWGLNWTGVSPEFVLGARIQAEARLCSDVSPRSPQEIAQPEPSTIPPGSLNPPVVEGATQVLAYGQSPGDPLEHGVKVSILDGASTVGFSVAPGGTGHHMGVNPPVSTSGAYKVRQDLCSKGEESTDTIPVVPCAEMPPAKIKLPVPGDTQVVATEYVVAAQILVFANGQEIGDSSPPVINLSRPIADGETIAVLQILGDCESPWIFVDVAECENLGGDDMACSGDWPAFRHDGLRTAHQRQPSAISDPYQVKKLAVQWDFPSAALAAEHTQRGHGFLAFRSSPIVWKGTVYIGNANGYLYAVDAATGALQWQYPLIDDDPLDSEFHSNQSSYGLAASAAIARIGEEDAIVFGAPDRSIGSGHGSGRLFALDTGGNEIWKTREIAVLDGTTSSSADAPTGEAELHEQFGYSSPLVFGNRIYIGIGNHGDNPIQKGRVAAVDMSSNVDAGFSFAGAATRGGGVWSSVAGGLEGGAVYITTGNTRCWNPGRCQPEPSPNHGLSMLRLNAATGADEWKLQPVHYDLDGDPDWAAGPTLLRATCDDVVMSTMKDGWSYGVRAAAPLAMRWQFPPTGLPFSKNSVHGDSRYLIPGAGWDDAYITTTGGEEIVNSTARGFTLLHALGACSGGIRWIAGEYLNAGQPGEQDLPGTSQGSSYQLGPPSVAGGIVYVGTAQGHLVALADPSVWPAAGSICENPAVDDADCAANNLSLVPKPNILRDVDLDSTDPNDRILTEPVLVDGRVFVATSERNQPGTLYMLAPERN